MNKSILLLSLITAVLLNPAAARAEETASKEYTIGIGDVLNISVLQPEELSLTSTVAPDGAITFPYIGTVAVKGNVLSAIQEEIQNRLADGYMKYPVVSVSLLESRSRRFFVYGEVIKPGAYFLEDDTSILKAVSMAGGFTRFGSSSRVKVLRARTSGPGYDALNINMKNVMNGDSDADLMIEPGDVIVVSEGLF